MQKKTKRLIFLGISLFIVVQDKDRFETITHVMSYFFTSTNPHSSTFVVLARFLVLALIAEPLHP